MGKARSGLSAGLACHRRSIVYGKAAMTVINESSIPFVRCHSVGPSSLEVRTGCLNWARPGLCGGRPATVVPTAIFAARGSPPHRLHNLLVAIGDASGRCKVVGRPPPGDGRRSAPQDGRHGLVQGVPIQLHPNPVVHARACGAVLARRHRRLSPTQSGRLLDWAGKEIAP